MYNQNSITTQEQEENETPYMVRVSRLQARDLINDLARDARLVDHDFLLTSALGAAREFLPAELIGPVDAILDASIQVSA